MPDKLHVLVVEDQPDDAELSIVELRRAGWEIEWNRVQTAAAFREALAELPDVILADYAMPSFTGTEALDILQQSGLDLPFIIVTGTGNEEIAVECLHRGADDYVLKSHLGRLSAAVQQALRRHEERAEKWRAEERASRLSRVLRAVSDIDQLIVRQRDRRQLLQEACSILLRIRDYHAVWAGLVSDDGQTVRPVAQAGTEADLSALAFRLNDPTSGPYCGRTALSRRQPVLIAQVSESEPCTACPYRAQTDHLSTLALPLAHGEHRFGLLTVYSEFPEDFDEEEIQLLTELSNDLGFALQAIEDEEKRRRAEAALRESEQRYRRLVELSPDAICVQSEDKIVFVNRAGAKFFGVENPEQLVGKSVWDFVSPDHREIVEERYRQMRERGMAAPLIEQRFIRPDGTYVDAGVTAIPITYKDKPAIQAIFRDITERKRAEALWRALNAVSTATQQAGLTETEIYQAAAEQMRALGLRGVVMLLDGAGENLAVRSVALPPHLVTAFEKLTGLSIVGYTFPREQADVYRRVLESGRPAFVAESPQVIAQLLPRGVRRLAGTIAELLGDMSGVYVPLYIRSRLAGVMGVAGPDVTEADLPAITAFADVLSAALGNARLYEEVKGHADKLAALYETGRDITSTLELDALLQLVVERAARLTGADRSLILLVDTQAENLIKAVGIGYAPGQIEGFTYREVQDGISGWVLREKTPWLSEDLSTDPRNTGLALERAKKERKRGRSIAVVPMFIKGEVSGTLTVVNKVGKPVFSQGDLDLVVMLANQAAIAIENARLYERAQREITERKKAEVALKASQEYARSIIGSSLNMIIAVDMERRIVEFNKAAQETFGYRLEEVLGEHVDVLYVDPQEGLRIHETTVERGQCIQETLNQRKSGEIFQSFLSASILRDARGEPVGVMGVSRDITTRKRAEAELRRRESYLRQLATIGETLLAAGDALTALPDALRRLGETAGVSRVYVFENHRDADGHLLTSQRLEWTDDQSTVQIDNPELQDFPFETLPRWVETMERGQAIAGPVRDYPPEERAVLEPQDILSLLVIPIFTGGAWWGFIGFDDCRTERAWEAVDREMLATATSLIGNALQRERAEAGLERRVRELAALHAVTAATSRSLNLAEVFEVGLQEVVALLEADSGAFYRLDEERDELVLMASHGIPPDMAPHLAHVPLDVGWVGLVARTGQTKVMDDIYREPELVFDGAREAGLHSAISLPVKMRGRVLGVMDIVTRAPRTFDPDEVQLLEAIAVQIAVAVENARLFEKVARAEHDWESTFDAMADAVSLHDADYRIVRANQALADVVGQPIQDIVGRVCYEVLHGTTEPIETCPHRRTMDTGQPATTIEQNTAHHPERVFDVTTTPIVDAEGHVTHTVHVMRDVTEQKKMQAQLIQSEKLAALGQLVAGVAHELNNPLTAVVGYAQLLQRTPLDIETQRQLDMIYHEAQRAAHIVRNLLTFARRHEAERRLCDVNDVVRRVLELRDYELRTSNVEVVTDLDPALPHTVADPHQLQQVFFNLISNAYQAMTEAHGRGTLTVRSLAVRGGEAVQVMVQDDGPGIPAEVRSKVFDPFFTTREVGQGTGLGLSVCYGIAADHGGRIWVESPSAGLGTGEVGQGATFIVELPVVQAEKSWVREALAQLEQLPAPGGGRILVVDDEPSIASLLADLLEPFGRRVIVAADGKAALQALEENGFDLIISDIKMPGLGGRELYARLRAERPELVERLVFITGDVVGPDTQDFLKEAGCRYLTKPFDLEAIETLLAEMLAEMSDG